MVTTRQTALDGCHRRAGGSGKEEYLGQDNIFNSIAARRAQATTLSCHCAGNTYWAVHDRGRSRCIVEQRRTWRRCCPGIYPQPVPSPEGNTQGKNWNFSLSQVGMKL